MHEALWTLFLVNALTPLQTVPPPPPVRPYYGQVYVQPYDVRSYPVTRVPGYGVPYGYGVPVVDVDVLGDPLE